MNMKMNFRMYFYLGTLIIGGLASYAGMSAQATTELKITLNYEDAYTSQPMEQTLIWNLNQPSIPSPAMEKAVVLTEIGNTIKSTLLKSEKCWNPSHISQDKPWPSVTEVTPFPVAPWKNETKITEEKKLLTDEQCKENKAIATALRENLDSLEKRWEMEQPYLSRDPDLKHLVSLSRTLAKNIEKNAYVLTTPATENMFATEQLCGFSMFKNLIESGFVPPDGAFNLYDLYREFDINLPDSDRCKGNVCLRKDIKLDHKNNKVHIAFSIEVKSVETESVKKPLNFTIINRTRHTDNVKSAVDIINQIMLEMEPRDLMNLSQGRPDLDKQNSEQTSYFSILMKQNAKDGYENALVLFSDSIANGNLDITQVTFDSQLREHISQFGAEDGERLVETFYGQEHPAAYNFTLALSDFSGWKREKTYGLHPYWKLDDENKLHIPSLGVEDSRGIFVVEFQTSENK